MSGAHHWEELGKATSGREGQCPLRDRGLEKTADPASAGPHVPRCCPTWWGPASAEALVSSQMPGRGGAVSQPGNEKTGQSRACGRAHLRSALLGGDGRWGRCRGCRRACVGAGPHPHAEHSLEGAGSAGRPASPLPSRDGAQVGSQAFLPGLPGAPAWSASGLTE